MEKVKKGGEFLNWLLVLLMKATVLILLYLLENWTERHFETFNSRLL